MPVNRRAWVEQGTRRRLLVQRAVNELSFTPFLAPDESCATVILGVKRVWDNFQRFQVLEQFDEARATARVGIRARRAAPRCPDMRLRRVPFNRLAVSI